jgi:FG-GAP-like repeat/Bacterial Ig-like domain
MNPHSIRSYHLGLEALEARLPPGDLLGHSLLSGVWLPGRSASQASELREVTQILDRQPDGYSPTTFTASEGGNNDADTESLIAHGAAPESARAPWDHLLNPMKDIRPAPAGFSQVEHLSMAPGTNQRLADGSAQTGSLIAGTPAVGSMFSAATDLQGEARALSLFVQQLPVSMQRGGGGSIGRTGPSTTGELSVRATTPASNALAVPANTPIAVKFSKPVNAETLGAATFAVFGRASGMAQGTYKVSATGITVVFTPAQPFMTGEAVDVMLTHDLAAADGGTLRAAGYAWTFWIQAGLGGGSQFPEAGRIDTGTGVRTYGGAATDLNGDRLVDIAVVNEIAADLRVFMNQGDGTFGALTRYPIRRGASPTVAGDFNRDGFTDIASSNFEDNSMSVLLGNGDGTFQPSRAYTTGTTPSGIAGLDVNGDGAVELVIVNAASNRLSLFHNNGDGTFQPEAPFFSVPGATLYGLAAADMNNDGIMDLIVGAQQTRRVYILLGDGAGGFTQSAVQNSGGRPWVLRAADVNGDGHADVEIANNAEGNLAILLGDGAGNLSTPLTYPAGSLSVSVSLGDLNGDGSLDVVISNFSSRTYVIFTNNGAGQFTRTGTLMATRSGSCAILFDYSGDGLLDIGGVDELEDEIILWVNNA